MATSTASRRIRLSTSRVMVPTPGPNSTSTRARSQSISAIKCFTRNEELGTIDPNIDGCLKKFRANKTEEDVLLTDSCTVPGTSKGSLKQPNGAAASILDEVSRFHVCSMNQTSFGCRVQALLGRGS